MTRGRKPKPTHLKLIDGNPGKRRIDPPAKPVPSRPRCPAWLPPAAKAAWRRIVPDLDDRGILTKSDREKLAVLCSNIGQFEEVTQAIAATGFMIRGRDGNPVRNPLLITQSQLARIIASVGSDFGLDPAARARLAMPGTTDAPTLDDLLGGAP